jgi:hypothetical protein
MAVPTRDVLLLDQKHTVRLAALHGLLTVGRAKQALPAGAGADVELHLINANAGMVNRQNRYADQIRNGNIRGVGIGPNSAVTSIANTLGNKAWQRSGTSGLYTPNDNSLYTPDELGLAPHVIGLILGAIGAATIAAVASALFSSNDANAAAAQAAETTRLYDKYSQYIPADQREAFRADVQQSMAIVAKAARQDADDEKPGFFDKVGTAIIVGAAAAGLVGGFFIVKELRKP